ncbi:MAG TPA: DUF1501 domain-containing protein [Rhizomicrobium sp.]|nr:DUF1501 domain-containing protein [Rhizomicrobium sp.]
MQDDLLLNRRTLLKSALYSAPLFTAGRLYAAPASGPRLLVVFLRGAYDAANILVPVGSDFYYDSRPNIAIKKDVTLSLDGDWGLHPALKDTILPLWQQKEIAFIPFAGTDDTSRSHFETQDTIELGQPVGGSRNYQSGFMSRTAEVLSGTKPIAFTTQLPLTFRGGAAVPNIALNFAGKPAVAERNAALIQAMYQGQDLAPAVAQGFQVQSEVYNTFSSEMMAANRNAVTTRGFELSAQRIGVLMQDKFNLGFVDIGGWDTHVNQGGEQGYLSNRIGELGRGLVALKTALGPQWNDTLVIVVSEFGRTFRENGNRGTDHGHGSVYWVLGGAVRGGRIAGPQVAVSQANLFQDRDWPVLTDYRALIGGVLGKSYGLSKAQLAQIFPQATPVDLALV